MANLPPVVEPVPHLPDVLAENLDAVFCGINPALSAAIAGHHFSNPSNRFWRTLHLAGFTPHLIPATQDYTLLRYGYGITAAVARPTVSAGDLAPRELRAAVPDLERKLLYYRPRVIAFLGKPAISAIVRKPAVAWGQQAFTFAGSSVWVLPNPSGLNRAFSLNALVSAYRELREAL
ncbi:G/U mismatch-specific DNA glycosylase [Terriglobus albidus]|uniref:G/U mismatch-specific DNA glycosylase n=1 Tax=Terriglobus albidus TaxID=1592106 RepID=A0A5B9E673_9BACT|nr:G/U mismatch-specific DNA glycosylase [Terriglobus albidus]QEE27762.1 G/U mismatch-specific DNA glycosylase [Terriglobus albidus]